MKRPSTKVGGFLLEQNEIRLAKYDSMERMTFANLNCFFNTGENILKKYISLFCLYENL